MAVTYGDLLLQNTSGATVLSNTSDAINLGTLSNDINIISGNNTGIITNNPTGVTAGGFGFLNLIDFSPAVSTGFGVVLASFCNAVGVLAGGQSGVVVADFYNATGGGGITIASQSNSVNISAGNTILIQNSGNSGLTPTFAPLMIYDSSPSNLTNGRGVTIRSDNNGNNIYSGGLDGLVMIDAEPTGLGNGILLNSFNNNLRMFANTGIQMQNGTINPITITNYAPTSGGIFINDYATVANGGVLVRSQDNDVNIVSNNLGAGGVNVSVTGPAANITLTVNGPVSGVVLSNSFTGGSGTLTVDAGTHLYWNGTFIA